VSVKKTSLGLGKRRGRSQVAPINSGLESGIATRTKSTIVEIPKQKTPKANRTTTKAVNDALRAGGRDESLRRGGPHYLYFGGGEAVHWLSSSVKASRLSDLTVKQWIQEFDKLLANEKKLRKRMR
jgi:hypothetical protein